MTVSVVIPHYFVERQSNLSSMVRALGSGSVRPLEVVVWNNDAPFEAPPGVQVIQSPRNIGAKARFLAALTCRGEYVLFHDNDVCVHRETLAGLLEQAAERSITTLEGRRLRRGHPYSEGIEIYGAIVTAPVDVDISLGRLELVPRRLVNELIADIPFDDSNVMDDVWFSAAAARRGIRRRVVPCRGDRAFTNLPHHGVGSSVTNAADHYRMRDELCARLFVGELSAHMNEGRDGARRALNGRARYRASADHVACEIDGQPAILNLADGQYFGLDSVAARVWQLIEIPRTVDELLAVLDGEYDVEAGQLEADVRHLLDELAGHGLVGVSS